MDGAILALAALGALTWGAENYVGATISRELSSVRLALSMQVFGFLLISPVALAGPGSLTFNALAWGTIAAVAGVFGWVFMYAASAIGQIAVTQKIAAGLAAVLPFVAGVIAGFRPSHATIGGLGLVVISLLLLLTQSMNDAPDGGKYVHRRAVVFALISGVGLGSALVALGHTGSEDGIYPFAVYRFDAALVLVVVAVVLRLPLLPPRKNARGIALASVFSTIGDVAVIIALQQGSYALVPAIASLHPGVAAILARWLTNEKLRRVQVFAIVTGLVGIVLIQA